MTSHFVMIRLGLIFRLTQCHILLTAITEENNLPWGTTILDKKNAAKPSKDAW